MQSPRWKAQAVAVGLLAAALPSCATPPPEVREAERLAAGLRRVLAETPAEGGLRVLLAFGTEADLDLYVTDPLEETVYFANSPSASGGRLAEDLRCGPETAGDRVEVVRFAEPLPGHYRVGVDHPKGCGAPRPAGFALAVVRDGAVELLTGTVRPLEFRLAVLDFEVPEGAAAGPAEEPE